MTRSRRTTPPPPLPVTSSQAETASATATTTWWEKNIEIGAVTVVFAMAVLLGWLCLPTEAKHPGNVRLTAALLLTFATFLSGNALVLLSFSMLGLPDHLISRGQRAAARCLRAACPAMWVLTLLSLLLALVPKRLYFYVALALAAVITPAAAAACWFLMRYRRADGGAAAAADGEDDNRELDAASKITSWVTYSAFGGIVGAIFSVSKISSAKTEAGAVDAATSAAIFFMLATAILGLFVMTVSKKVADITDPRRRRFFVAAVRLSNTFLLCTLGCAGLAASYAVLRRRVFAAFAPLAATSAVSFLLRHCVARRAGAGSAGGEEDGDHEARVRAMEDAASKVMAASLTGIMSVLGGWLAEKDHARWGALDTSMVVLTSAFVSSFGFMVLAAAPGSAVRERLAPVAKVLIWSTALLFAATAVTVYGVEVSGVKP